jgi:hypothetical protein
MMNKIELGWQGLVSSPSRERNSISYFVLFWKLTGQEIAQLVFLYHFTLIASGI